MARTWKHIDSSSRIIRSLVDLAGSRLHEPSQLVEHRVVGVGAEVVVVRRKVLAQPLLPPLYGAGSELPLDVEWPDVCSELRAREACAGALVRIDVGKRVQLTTLQRARRLREALDILPRLVVMGWAVREGGALL